MNTSIVYGFGAMYKPREHNLRTILTSLPLCRHFYQIAVIISPPFLKLHEENVNTHISVSVILYFLPRKG